MSFNNSKNNTLLMSKRKHKQYKRNNDIDETNDEFIINPKIHFSNNQDIKYSLRSDPRIKRTNFKIKEEKIYELEESTEIFYRLITTLNQGQKFSINSENLEIASRNVQEIDSSKSINSLKRNWKTFIEESKKKFSKGERSPKSQSHPLNLSSTNVSSDEEIHQDVDCYIIEPCKKIDIGSEIKHSINLCAKSTINRQNISPNIESFKNSNIASPILNFSPVYKPINNLQPNLNNLSNSSMYLNQNSNYLNLLNYQNNFNPIQNNLFLQNSILNQYTNNMRNTFKAINQINYINQLKSQIMQPNLNIQNLIGIQNLSLINNNQNLLQKTDILKLLLNKQGFNI